MQKSLILWLFVILIVVIFAVLNATPVAVNLIVTSFQLSLALLIVIPLILGVTAGYTLDFVPRRRMKKRLKELENSLSAAEAELGGLRAKLETASARAATIRSAATPTLLSRTTSGENAPVSGSSGEGSATISASSSAAEQFPAVVSSPSEGTNAAEVRDGSDDRVTARPAPPRRLSLFHRSKR